MRTVDHHSIRATEDGVLRCEALYLEDCAAHFVEAFLDVPDDVRKRDALDLPFGNRMTVVVKVPESARTDEAILWRIHPAWVSIREDFARGARTTFLDVVFDLESVQRADTDRYAVVYRLTRCEVVDIENERDFSDEDDQR